MRKHLRFLSVALPFAVSSMVAACRLPEADARERLESEGLTKVLLVKTPAGFDWSARDAQGVRCTGTMRHDGEATSAWSVEKTCTDG